MIAIENPTIISMVKVNFRILEFIYLEFGFGCFSCINKSAAFLLSII
jgi:hypothetical protein